MLVTAMPSYERPDDWLHGEKKTGRQFMLTETASAAIEAIAKDLGISRSEVVERAARCGGMDVARQFDTQTGECSKDEKGKSGHPTK